MPQNKISGLEQYTSDLTGNQLKLLDKIMKECTTEQGDEGKCGLCFKKIPEQLFSKLVNCDHVYHTLCLQKHICKNLSGPRCNVCNNLIRQF